MKKIEVDACSDTENEDDEDELKDQITPVQI